MSAPASISVLIPIFQGAEFLERVLEALAAQRVDVPFDVHAVDSGSTDGTLELLERWRDRLGLPFHVRSIHPAEFDHGDTRNSLAAESQGELLVYLTQDAVPSDEGWLAGLHGNFGDPRVGAAYSRNVHRPEADLLTRLSTRLDPGYAEGRREVRLPSDYPTLDPEGRRQLYNFNDVASAIRRDLWERHPFPRTDFGEDLLMARALLEAGYTVVYDDRATVEHSHDYGPRELRARARIDGRFNVEHFGRVCVASSEDARLLVERQLVVDRAALEAEGLADEALEAALARARELRAATFEGLWEGGREALESGRRPRPTAMRDKAALKVLYAVHGFPPDTWAGTEVYTLELAREVQRRGHDVTVLTRAPLRRGQEPFDLTEERFEDLRVLRLATDIDYKKVRDSYANRPVEELFAEVLQREQPDVVHFQHLLHLSAGLPLVCRQLGVPSVVTCNDYWGLCARVQLIRPDGERCEENQGMGCFWCLKNERTERVPAARRWLGLATPAFRAARAAVEALGVDMDQPIPSPGPRGSKVARRLQGFEDIRTRQDYVLGGYGAAELCIAPSRFLRQKYLDSGAFDPDRFVYSDYGMRPQVQQPAAGARSSGAGHTAGGREATEPVRFAFIGTLIWFKGVDVLLEAFARLDPERARLAVHGAFEPATNEHHARLRDMAGPGVEFHGRFDNQRLAEIYEDIDVLVVPSVWFENSPITIHEAFQFRTPLVTSDIGGMAELVAERRGGLCFRAGDAGDLARVLQRFVDEPALRSELSDFPRVKTIEENAREMEFRYRFLACMRP